MTDTYTSPTTSVAVPTDIVLTFRHVGQDRTQDLRRLLKYASRSCRLVCTHAAEVDRSDG